MFGEESEGVAAPTPLRLSICDSRFTPQQGHEHERHCGPGATVLDLLTPST